MDEEILKIKQKSSRNPQKKKNLEVFESKSTDSTVT